MRIAISANGSDLDAEFVPLFGRSPTYVFVDTESLAFEAVPNPATGSAGGAGIQAAQYVASRGVGAVVTGHVGPNAFQVLAAAGVPVFIFTGSTVREAVNAYMAGRLSPASGATGPAHAGLGPMRGRGIGGVGRGRIRAGGYEGSRNAGVPLGVQVASEAERQDDLTELRSEVESLREHLNKLGERLDDLESKCR
jgi:predicted Fe-Mo cluster-binding NifX family protein